jgi:cation diffusion facilitator family transporter
MSPTATHQQAPSQPHAAKRSAAIFSVVAASLITLLKLLTGLLTGSLGMLSEAAHSAIDLIASAITLFSVEVSDRPADEDHNYGHGKVESLSAFVETGIMLASCVWIVNEAVHRIVYHHHLALKTSLWPFAVLLLSIVVDFTRSRTLGRIAREHRSDALAADSVHFATDMWASLAVMLGLGATFAGEHYSLPWLEYADPIAGILVAGVILRVSWRLARQTVDALLDATPTTDPTSNEPQSKDQLRSNLIHDLTAIPGVLSVDRLRTRRSGANYFADVTLGMPRNLTFQRCNLSIHEIGVQHVDGGLHVEQHLEVDETMPLRQAHELVTNLEAEMRREVPDISSILTHIESEPATIEHPASLERDRELEVRLRQVADGFPEILDIHEVFVTRSRSRAASGAAEHLQVSCHCTLPDDLPMASVHAVITALEGAFKLDVPDVDRLLIHPEPATDNRR